jgi:lipopolysaccharide/colanic/teichoic acid biosynthesis glycosyltransferase
MKLFGRGCDSLPYQRSGKRAFDVITAATAIFIFVPILLLISLAIKIESRGPIFRRHIRYGYDGEELLVLKFRTEEMNAAGRYSTRLTRIGHISRQTGIEGLPQLVNVLRGEMSMVGPQPFLTIPKKVLADQISGRSRQHKIKPGILGWAQVHGCWGETDTGKALGRRIEYDAYYAEHWSFVLDMEIILRALFSKSSYSNSPSGAG